MAGKGARHAAVFAALGDETRLSIVDRLGTGVERSITELALERPITRQAMTKHLRVLEGAGIVSASKSGRQVVFKLVPGALRSADEYLRRVSEQWGDALGRLKAFAEK